MLVAEANDLTPYVDGMGVEVTRLVRRHPEFLRDPEALRRAGDGRRALRDRSRRPAQTDRRRQRADNHYLRNARRRSGPLVPPEIRSNPTNTVTLTGYQVEGTPGRAELQERGRRLAINGTVRPVSARVESFDFSAHARPRGWRRS